MGPTMFVTQPIVAAVTGQVDIAALVTLSDGQILGVGLVTIVILVGLSAFFSSSEIAMFSLAAHRVESLAEEGSRAGEVLAGLKADPHRLLVTILVGNNLINIAMSSIATGLLALYLDQGTAVVVATIAITGVVLLFGESAPKSYAVENTESWALRIARPLKLAEQLLLPLVVLFDYLTRQLNRITGGRGTIESSYVTRQEIREIIETGEREGVIETDERELLQRVFRFHRTIAKEVMTPRLDMRAIPRTADIEEAITTCIEAGHARLPVYEDSLDNIVGMVHVRDLVRDLNYGSRDSEQLSLDALVEPTLHVPESKNVDELLTEMRNSRMPMVIVIDEFGTTEGLVTMEDLTEEIVGEILEGEEDEPIEFIDADTALVRGEVNVEEVNDALDIELPEGEEFETIAGFIFNRAGRLVEEGEVISFESVDIRAEEVQNTRILKAHVSAVRGRLGADQTTPEEIDPHD